MRWADSFGIRPYAEPGPTPQSASLPGRRAWSVQSGVQAPPRPRTRPLRHPTAPYVLDHSGRRQEAPIPTLCLKICIWGAPRGSPPQPCRTTGLLPPPPAPLGGRRAGGGGSRPLAHVCRAAPAFQRGGSAGPSPSISPSLAPSRRCPGRQAELCPAHAFLTQTLGSTPERKKAALGGRGPKPVELVRKWHGSELLPAGWPWS